MARADLHPDDLEDLLEACRELIDANERRAQDAHFLTLAEQQAIGVLWIRLEDLREQEQAPRRVRS